MKRSRTPDIDIKKCVEVVGDQYNMILIAAERARQISKRRHNDFSFEVSHPVNTALQEIERQAK